jgi:vitamin B12 transporter
MSRRVTLCVFRLAQVLALSTIIANVARAQDDQTATATSPIVVSASRLETRESDVASSVTIISEEDLRRGQYTSVLQALRKVPGLDLVQSGGAGGNVAAFLRGANSEHTLVLMDGIELNNPASPSRAYNLANLTLENVERIEVIRGPQSMLYGSDAMGGVINIITKRADQGAKVSVSSEAGSYRSFNQVAQVAYGDKALESTTGVTRQDLGNISAADASDGNSEHDGYENTSLTNTSRIHLTDNTDVTSTTRYARSHASLDSFGGVGGDDPNRFLFNEEFFTRGEIAGNHLAKTLTTSAWVSYAHHYLKDYNSPDAVSIDTLRSSYGGDLLDVGGKAVWSPRRYFSAVVGGETQRERADSSYFSDGAWGPYQDDLSGAGARTNSIYGESKVSFEDTLFLDSGVRHDSHSIFGDRTTFRVAPAVLVGQTTKVRGSVGTGFKAPSLVQLYSSYGNPDLAAERNLGWDVGVDQSIFKKSVTASLTYFRTSFENLISFNPSTFILENISQAKTQGFESAVSATLSDTVSARVAYTYTDTQDDKTGEALLRRPKNKGSVALTYTPTTRFVTTLAWRAYSSRFDNDFSGAAPQRIALAGYGLVDINASYELSKNIKLFTRIENLFDQEYQEVYGFGTMGAAAYAGVALSQ